MKNGTYGGENTHELYYRFFSSSTQQLHWQKPQIGLHTETLGEKPKFVVPLLFKKKKYNLIEKAGI